MNKFWKLFFRIYSIIAIGIVVPTLIAAFFFPEIVWQLISAAFGALATGIAFDSNLRARNTDESTKEILKRLDKIVPTHRSLLAEAIARIVDYLIERKAGGNK